MGIISRGFSGRRSAADVKLPPGQYLTTDFPVLSAGPTPHVSLNRWEFTIDDGSNVLKRWDWKSFRELPSETITVDIHCVTRWSKLGTSWEGVSLDVLLADLKTDLSYATRPGPQILPPLATFAAPHRSLKALLASLAPLATALTRSGRSVLDPPEIANELTYVRLRLP